MAKGPKPRDPAKHSKKDPAKPTRAKASRPDVPAMDSSLADILNPALSKGRAGLGAQTGIEARKNNTRDPSPLVGEGWEGGSAVVHQR
jgi:excinuclease ABC subunit B